MLTGLVDQIAMFVTDPSFQLKRKEQDWEEDSTNVVLSNTKNIIQTATNSMILAEGKRRVLLVTVYLNLQNRALMVLP